MTKFHLSRKRAILAIAIVLVMTAAAPRVQASGKGEGSDIEIGGPGEGNGKLIWLRDLAFDSRNVLYALDGSNDYAFDGPGAKPVLKFNGNLLVQKFDATDGQFLSQISIREEKLDRLDQPTRLTIDSQGSIYIAVPLAGVVQRFTANGKLIADIAMPDVSAVAFQSVKGAGRILVGTAPRKDNQWTPVDTLETLTLQGASGDSVKLSRAVSNIEDIRCDREGNIYVLGGIHQIFKFDTQGELKKVIGGGTELRLEDGSELFDSVAVDSRRNIYSMTAGNPSSLAQFDADVTTVTMRKGQFHWADAWFGGSMVAIDQKDRIWIGAPGNTAGDAKYHYRPCIFRLATNYFDPTIAGAGVTSRSTRLLGLNLKATCNLPYNVSTDLAPTEAEFVVVAGSRQISDMEVDWHAYDLWKNPVASGKFSLQLKDGEKSRQTVSFTPPKYGWYEVSFEASSQGQPLMGIATNVGFTPKYPGMIDLPAGSTKGGWVDPVRQAFCGLPFIRVDSGQINTPALADTILKNVADNHMTLQVEFQSRADCAPENVTKIVTLLKGRAKYYEIINEPNFSIDPVSYVNMVLRPTRELILSIDPDAKILGPDTCGIDLGWYEQFYKNGGKDLVDYLSIHDYEGYESIDPGHWRWKIGELRKIMARYGDADKPIWQTERAIGGVRMGDFIPAVQVVGVLLERDLMEILGTPAEHNNLYYMNNAGYSAVPTFVWSDSGPHPAALATRTRQAMIAGRQYSGTIDFGPSGNKLFMGLRYAGDDGATITLRNYGQLDLPLDLPITGGDSVQVVDAFGNEQSFPIQDNHVHLVTSNLPIYLRLEKRQEIGPAVIDFGPNLATQATFHYSAAFEGDYSLLNNGIFEAEHPSNPHHKFWSGDLSSSPQYLEIDLGRRAAVNRLLIFAAHGDNTYCALLDYDIQAFDGTDWNTIQKVRSYCPPSDPVLTADCHSTSWYMDQNLFNNTFPTVKTSKLRLKVLRTTWGFMADKAATQACSLVFTTPHLMLREIEIYGPQSETEARTPVGQ